MLVTARGSRSSVRYALARAVTRGAGSAPNNPRAARLFRYYAENRDSPIGNGANVVTAARKFIQCPHAVERPGRKVASGASSGRVDRLRRRQFALLEPPALAERRLVAALGVDSGNGAVAICAARRRLAGGEPGSRASAASSSGRERRVSRMLRDRSIFRMGPI